MKDTDYIAGLDLGQQNDRTALVILDAEDPPAWKDEDRFYRARHIQRFETGRPYTDMVGDVEALLQQAPLRGRTSLVVDATGVGRAVTDLFGHIGRRCVSVTITGGQSANKKGDEWTVPKASLASTTQALLQTDRLRFSERVPTTDVLLQELKDFRVKITDGGHAKFEHREGKHDDLVLACALAAWYAEQGLRRKKVWADVLDAN
jgi:hypothetical protein